MRQPRFLLPLANSAVSELVREHAERVLQRRKGREELLIGTAAATLALAESTKLHFAALLAPRARPLPLPELLCWLGVTVEDQ